MAAARSYRDDLQRPHCGSNWLPKDGRSRGKQTRRCRLCHYRFTPDGNRHYYPEQVKEQARAYPLSGGGQAEPSRRWLRRSQIAFHPQPQQPQLPPRTHPPPELPRRPPPRQQQQTAG